MVFSSLIAVNGMFTSHCENLSTHHYHLTYHPSFNMQFCHSQTMQQYFCAVAMSLRKKWKRSSCPLAPKRAVKRKKGNCFDTKSCPGQLCGTNFVAPFVSTDHMTRKQFVLFPIQFIQTLSLERANFPGFSVSWSVPCNNGYIIWWHLNVSSVQGSQQRAVSSQWMPYCIAVGNDIPVCQLSR